MSSLVATLKSLARLKAQQQGHTLRAWHRRPNDPHGRWNAYCTTCNAAVVIGPTIVAGFPSDSYGPALTIPCGHAMPREGADMIDLYGDPRPLPVRPCPPPQTPPFVPTAAYAGTQKEVDTPIALVVGSPYQPHVAASIQEKHMTLTRKAISKNGQDAIYTGAAVTVSFKVAAFPNKTAPETIDVADGIFAPAKAPKPVETKEERKARLAALPKLTLAEKIAKREAALAALKAKAAAENQPGL